MTRSRKSGVLCAFVAGVSALAAVATPQWSVAEDSPSGAATFAARCAVCHGSEAAGIPGTFPSLREQIMAFAKSPEGRDYLVMVVTTGLMGQLKVAGVTYNNVMPAQSGLTEAEVAAVLSYLAGGRTQEANRPALAAADVIAARSRHSERTAQATHALRPAMSDP